MCVASSSRMNGPAAGPTAFAAGCRKNTIRKIAPPQAIILMREVQPAARAASGF